MAIKKTISKPPMLAHNAQSLGAYFFNPCEIAKLLKTENYCDIVSWATLHGFLMEYNTPVYLVGFLVCKYTSTVTNRVSYRSMQSEVQPYDTYAGVSSIVQVYTHPDYSDDAVINVEIDGVSALDELVSLLGIRVSLAEGCSHAQVAGALSSPVLEPASMPKKKIANATKPKEMSREDILLCLKKMKECTYSKNTLERCPRDCPRCEHYVDSQNAMKALDAAIKAYESVMSQNRTGKCVRMADGSRKWFSLEDAEKMLKLPKEERK